MVKFLNLVPWGGLYFCYAPGQVIDLPEDTATEREKLGLGKLVVDKSRKASEPKVEPVAEVKGEATVGTPEIKPEPPKPPAPAPTPPPAPPAPPAQAKPAV